MSIEQSCDLRVSAHALHLRVLGQYPRTAFTLIELLVVIAIIAILMSLVLPAVGAARQQGKLVREYAAARTLHIGYTQYAADHRGSLLPGHIADTPTMVDDRGKTLSPVEVVKRWPWRLVSYLECGVNGSLLVNEQAAALKDRNMALWSYAVSLTPSLGLNISALGGDQAAPHKDLPGCLKKIDAGIRPSWQVVFVSARFPGGTGANGWGTHGYWSLDAPRKASQYSATGWSAQSYSERGEPAAWGYIHPRWSGKADVMHLDGHLEGLSIDQLRDMTRWADRAARLNDPEWNGATSAQ